MRTRVDELLSSLPDPRNGPVDDRWEWAAPLLLDPALRTFLRGWRGWSDDSRDVVIDEAQEDPRLFRQLRGVVDAARRESGRFLLTGSSSPDLLRHASESLAGRIAIVEVGTLKMNEIARLPLPPFYRLLEQELSRETLHAVRELDCPVPDV